MWTDPWFETSTLGAIAWQTTSLLVLGLVVAVIMRRRPARSHAILTWTLAATAFLPACAIIARTLNIGLLPGREHVVPLMPTFAVPAAFSAPSVAETTWSITAILTMAWLACSALVVVHLMRSIIECRLLVRRARPLDRDDWAHAVSDLASTMGIRRPITLWQSDLVACPVVWCWGRTVRIIVPAAMAREVSFEDLRAVMLHELAHVQRRDHLASLFADLVWCVLPWHPVVWLVRREHRLLAELSCDRRAVTSGVRPIDLARVLVTLATTRERPLTLAASSSAIGLRRRVVVLLKRPGRDVVVGRMMWVTGLSFALLLTMMMATIHRRDVRPRELDLMLVGQVSPALPTDEAAPGLAMATAAIDGAHPVRVLPGELTMEPAADGDVRTATIVLVNLAQESVRLTRTKASCGCTTIDGFQPQTLDPGALIELDITVRASGAPGQRTTKNVTFFIEGHDPVTLPVHIDVVEPAPQIS